MRKGGDGGRRGGDGGGKDGREGVYSMGLNEGEEMLEEDKGCGGGDEEWRR